MGDVNSTRGNKGFHRVRWWCISFRLDLMLRSRYNNGNCSRSPHICILHFTVPRLSLFFCVSACIWRHELCFRGQVEELNITCDYRATELESGRLQLWWEVSTMHHRAAQKLIFCRAAFWKRSTPAATHLNRQYCASGTFPHSIVCGALLGGDHQPEYVSFQGQSGDTGFIN